MDSADMSHGLNRLSATQIVSGIRSGEFTALEVVRDCLSRIEQRENEVGAFVSFEPELVIEQARLADNSSHQGPMQGVPFVAKDIIDTLDYPTAWGTSVYTGYRSPRNASCVELFKRAGAILIGKTVTTEFAYFQPGKTANPANLSHTPGGSSSGSAAAVADHMVPLGFGSQTAASLIRPAAYCGVLGYKPSHGAFSLDGVMGLSPSLDTLGLLSRNVEDIQLARSVLSGAVADGGTNFDESPPRVVLMRGPHWDEGSIEMRDVCLRAMSQLAGCGAETGELTHPPIFNELTDCQKTVMAFEVARERIFEYDHYIDRISPQFIELVESGLAVSYPDYLNALNIKVQAASVLDRLFMDVDAIVAPAAPGEAPKGLAATGDPLYSRGWNLLQVPCVSIPYGTGPNGLPLSIQLIGPYGADARLLSVAQWVNRSLRGKPCL